VIGGHEKDGVRYWHGLVSDVTERKQLEQQLILSQKIEAVGRLAGGIAHDFNNLLTMINGYSQLILERLEPDAPFAPFVKEIRDAGERAASLTRQLLAFSRRQIMTFQVLDLNSVISGLEKMLKRLIGEDILLRTVLDPDLGHVKADPGQIEQIVMNLAVNARDAMPLGGELTLETANAQLDEVFVRTHIGATAGPSVMLALSDTGAGMTVDTRARIFEPFFTTKEPGKGTGLGLATVYGIVKQMGGSIWVSSELGQGSVFKIYFPRVDEVPAAEKKAEAQSDPVFRSETILLVEDEVGVRAFVCSALESSGYKVLVAKDAEDAISICEKHDGSIHLLLTDVVMPRMSGPMVAERVRSLRPGIKVLYTSGHTDHPVLRREVLGAHMDFLAKPFSPDALLKKIQEVLTQLPKLG
jgi:nitrogen-specific signal transduction histidine kinase/ActR/RegA family two-component response regulator